MTNEDGDKIEGDVETVTDAERAKLEANGYYPVVRWKKHCGGCIVICTTGEALKNIEIEEERKKRGQR